MKKETYTQFKARRALPLLIALLLLLTGNAVAQEELSSSSVGEESSSSSVIELSSSSNAGEEPSSSSVIEQSSSSDTGEEPSSSSVIEQSILLADIIITAPASGKVPVTTASSYPYIPIDYTIGTVSWSPEVEDVFLVGKEYTATVTLTANTGYYFESLTTATINGQEATIENNTGSELTLSYTFPETKVIPIPIVSVSISKPVIDKIPQPAVTLSYYINYTSSKVSWSPEDERFIAGKKYTATVTLTAKTGYTFEGLTTATINGIEGTIVKNEGSTVTISSKELEPKQYIPSGACSGKTVYIQLPENWGDETYITWDGSTIPIAGITTGSWTEFNLPTGLSGDVANLQEIVFTNIKDYNSLDDNLGTINARGFYKGQGYQSVDADKFYCSYFADEGTWIMRDPESITQPDNGTGKTKWSYKPFNAKFLYFFPPNDPKWFTGKSYLFDGTTKTWLKPVLGMCSWYEAVYFNTEPPESVEIWLGQNGKDKIGDIPLKQLFESKGDSLYFVADKGYPAGMLSENPYLYEDSRCAFNLAAFIYDTDPSVHPDFSCGVYFDEDNCTEAPTNTNKKSSCTGVMPGLVKPTLNPNTKKPEYSGVDPNNCWTSAADFDNAFKSTSGVNVKHLYEIPLKQTANGRYEFDSNKLLNTSGRLVGGFFTQVLDYAPVDSTCPSCNTKRRAEVFTPLNLEIISEEDFDRYNAKPGDFKDGAVPSNIPGTIPSATGGSIWDWRKRDTLNWYLHGNTAMGYYAYRDVYGLANQHFCFESHANFVYSPEQEFLIRGDDDIWVYINNQLVIDLGGAHMAAPGHVELNTLNLEEGKEYPIDIFFCDRRTTQSNIKINTNMYLTQNNNTTTIAEINITVPVAGETPATTTQTSYTSGTVTWQPAVEDKFLANTEYTATVVLTAKEGYSLANLETVIININGSLIPISLANLDTAIINGFATIVKNADGTVTLTCKFPSTGPVPIIPQIASGKIKAQTIGNNIVLQNLPTNSKVEVYNLKGNRIYLGNTENISTLNIGVRAKGMYVVKSSFGSEKQVVRVVVR